MTTQLPTPTVYYANGLNAGHGHVKITVELELDGEYKKFYHTTSYMPGWDEATDLEGQDKYDALYALIENDIEDEVIEWVTALS